MTWFGWLYLAWLAFGTLVTIGQIGKERKPLEPSTAVLIVVLNAAAGVGFLAIGTGSL